MKNSRAWKDFEERVIRDAGSRDVLLYKLPERFQNVYSKKKTVQQKTPFDCFGSIDGRALYLDCKSLSTNKFLFSQVCFAKNKIHQWQALKRGYDMGCLAGYLVHFYMESKVCWISVKNIAEAYAEGRKYLFPNDVRWQEDNRLINLRDLIIE